MNKIFYFFTFTFLFNDLLASPFDKLKSGFDSIKGKYDDAKSKVDEVKSKVDEVKDKVDEVKGEFKDAKEKINEVRDDVNGVIQDIDGKYRDIMGGEKSNNSEHEGDTHINTEQKLGQNNNEYVEWVKRLQNLSPAGLKQLVKDRNYYMSKTRELEECIRTSRNSKKFVLITDVSIEKK